ncbi:MAG: hypothetical protein KGN84_09555 [Acidobacteriota bacterium]|nr:hypothetical protein [Acidobacteriota bacterium]
MNTVFALLLFFQQTKLPEATGKRELLRSCGACHPAEVVLNNYNSRQGWTELVDEMISRGAKASSAERKQIIKYLSRNFAFRSN